VTSDEVEVPCKEADMAVKRIYYVTMYLEGFRKTKKVLRQNSKPAGQVSDPRFNECEAGV